MEYDVEIVDVEFWDGNELSKGGMRVYWSANNVGFGITNIYKNENNKIIIDDEYMGEKFVKELLNKLVNDYFIDYI